MATEPDYGLYLNVTTLLGLMGAVATGIWKVTRIEKDIVEVGLARDEELRAEMEAKFESAARDRLQLERDGLGRAETIRHEAGEMGAALRTKIHEIEVYNRDTFVSTKSFEQVISRIESWIDKLGDRLEAKIDRIGRRD